MLVVHHLNNSRSQRVLWLLEELEEVAFSSSQQTQAFVAETAVASLA